MVHARHMALQHCPATHALALTLAVPVAEADLKPLADAGFPVLAQDMIGRWLGGNCSGRGRSSGRRGGGSGGRCGNVDVLPRARGGVTARASASQRWPLPVGTHCRNWWCQSSRWAP